MTEWNSRTPNYKKNLNTSYVEKVGYLKEKNNSESRGWNKMESLLQSAEGHGTSVQDSIPSSIIKLSKSLITEHSLGPHSIPCSILATLRNSSFSCSFLSFPNPLPSPLFSFPSFSFVPFPFFFCYPWNKSATTFHKQAGLGARTPRLGYWVVLG